MSFFQEKCTKILDFNRKNHWYFPIILCLLGLLIRLIFLWGNTIPYMYDHARDSVEIMQMLRTHKPVLIGPRASIEGLFFGPLWYYLTAPFYLVGAGHPLAPVGLVLVLYVTEVFLAYKYFGKWPAIMMTFTHGWWWISTSAWNPFPLAFISLLLLIILKKTWQAQRVSLFQAVLLGLVSSFGFHFSTAYAMFYPVIIATCLWRQKARWHWQQFFLFSLFFLIPWLPQIAFDVRHDFLQFKAVFAYINGPSLVEFSFLKIVDTIMTISSTLFWANLPGATLLPSFIERVIGVLIAGVALFFFVKELRSGRASKNVGKLLNHAAAKGAKTSVQISPSDDFLFEPWQFILIPFLGYTFLHFSLWYVVGMYPAGALILTHYFSKLGKKWQVLLMVAYLLSAVILVTRYLSYERVNLMNNRNFLPAKLRAIQTVRELSEGKPFSSYQFVPDVYDYTYQYLYLWQAQHGWTLPVEFSYQPSPPLYYSQKPSLLESFSAQSLPTDTIPNHIFFIVEKPEYQHVLDEWWTRQLPHKVVKEIKISEDLTLYQAVAEK